MGLRFASFRVVRKAFERLVYGVGFRVYATTQSTLQWTTPKKQIPESILKVLGSFKTQAQQLDMQAMRAQKRLKVEEGDLG